MPRVLKQGDLPACPSLPSPVTSLPQWRNGTTWLAESVAFVVARSNTPSARQRAAVLKAVAQGDLSRAMDAMMDWAISHRRNPTG